MMKKYIFLLCYWMFIAVLLFNQGCKEDVLGPATINLTDPSVKPTVIFTFPQHGSKGSYIDNNTGIYSGTFHFFLQFNKLMDLNTLSSSAISIKGFDYDVDVQQQYMYGYSGYGDIIKFYVQKRGSYSNAQYVLGKEYTVTVKSSVRDIHGYTLQGDYIFSYTPEPVFRVISRSPESEVITSGSFGLSMKFNSAVNSAILSHLKISPQMNGKWSISNSESTMVTFLPAVDYTINTLYTVEVDANAQDAANNTIASRYQFSFTKKYAFSVIGAYINDYEQINSLHVDCNGEIDTATVPGAFSISPSMSGKFRYNVYGNGSFQFIPDSEFTPVTTYTLSISNALKSKLGIPVQPFSKQITSNSFYVISMYPSSSAASRYSSIEIRTNYQVDTASARAAFSISPSVPGTLTAYKNYIHFVPAQILAPNTTYSISVSTVLKTRAGYPLQNSSIHSFKTGS